MVQTKQNKIEKSSPRKQHFLAYELKKPKESQQLSIPITNSFRRGRVPKPPDNGSVKMAAPELEKLLSSYLGISFTIFLGSLPKNSISLIPALKSQNQELSFKLRKAEEQLRQLLSSRKEDSKANARVVEIFANQRHGWQQQEKALLQQIDESTEEIAHLRAKVEDLEKMEAEFRDNLQQLKRDVSERDEMLNYMSANGRGCEMDDGDGGGGGDGGGECYPDLGVEECYMGGRVHSMEELESLYAQSNGYSQEFMGSASKFWAERGTPWQDNMPYESPEPRYHVKHFVARRESPWKVDGDSTGVSSKLKLLEQELLNLEKVGKSDQSKMPALLRKQAKRYQTLAGKIDDLCGRMQASDPCEPTLSPEFRTQRQTEFLLEAFRLQQRAAETSQKLLALQAETGKGCMETELDGHAQFAIRRALDSIRNNFKEIQRNLEIWLARIIGDLEGILARDGTSRMREYYISRYPYVQ